MLASSAPSEQATLISDSAIQQGQTEEGTTEASARNEQQVNRGPMDYRSLTDDDSCFGMETENGSLARSTLAQALHCPAEVREIAYPNDFSNESVPPEVRADPGQNPCLLQ